MPLECTEKLTRANTENCEMVYEFTSKSDGERAYFCLKHKKWAYDPPMTVTFQYQDGSQFTQPIREMKRGGHARDENCKGNTV